MIDCCLVLLALAQDPFPKPGADPTGVVLDGGGKPIAGAKVALRCDLEGSKPWSRALAQVLAKAPLPATATNHDGTFVLPLAPVQRLLGMSGEGKFALVVEKDGCQRWHEALHDGIAGYLGSRVVLYPLDERDDVAVEVADSTPGLRLQVRRLCDYDPDAGRTVDVPANGKMTVRLPLAQNPRLPLTFFEPLALGYKALLWRGETLLASKELDPSGPYVWPKAQWGAESELPVHNGAPASQPTADAARETDGGALLRVLDASGAPIEGALALCGDAGWSAGRPQDLAPRSDARGEARFTGLAPGKLPVHVLRDGFLPAGVDIEVPAQKPIEVRLEPARLARVWLVQDDARPAAFRPVAVEARRGTGDVPSRFAASDSLGRLCLTVSTTARAQLEPMGDPKAKAYVPLAGDDVVQKLSASDECCVLVRLPFGTKVTDCEYASRVGSGSTGFPAPAGLSGFLLRVAPVDDRSALVFEGKATPRIEVTPAELKAAPRARDLVLVDRSKRP